MKITVDGLTVERPDGSVRCIGYGTDTDGRVTIRFALPNGAECSVPDATHDIEYVSEMAELPPLDDAYKVAP